MKYEIELPVFCCDECEGGVIQVTYSPEDGCFWVKPCPECRRREKKHHDEEIEAAVKIELEGYQDPTRWDPCVR